MAYVNWLISKNNSDLLGKKLLTDETGKILTMCILVYGSYGKGPSTWNL